MTPEQFAAVWDTPLVLLSPGAQPPQVPAEAVAFLAQAGLPRGLRYGIQPIHLAFARIEGGLTRLCNEEDAGSIATRRSPSSAEEYFILGEQWVDGGAAPFWCIHGPSGRLDVVDLEAEDRHVVSFANTNVACLAGTLVAVRQWVTHLGGYGADRSRALEELRMLLKGADPHAAGKSDWFDWVDSLDCEDVDLSAIGCEAEFIDGPRVRVLR